MASHYELSRTATGHGWHAEYFDESGRMVGEGDGFTARGARHRAGAAAKDKLRSELGRMRRTRHYHLYRAGDRARPMTKGYATKAQANRVLASVAANNVGHVPKVAVKSCTDPGCVIFTGAARTRRRASVPRSHAAKLRRARGLR